jgi:hypothetical protein
MIPAMPKRIDMTDRPQDLANLPLPEHLVRLAPPAIPPAFVAPIKWDADTRVKTGKGTWKKRNGSFSAARRMLDCEPEKLRAILKSGLIYAYKGTDADKSWWVLDLAGVYLYRDNQRRKAVSLPPSPDWLAYSAHMAALNAAVPSAMGPPPVEPGTVAGMYPAAP